MSQVSNGLQQLENREAMLVLYVANELSSAQRAEVDRMLGSDSALRAELAELQAANDLFTSTMSALDGSTRLPVPEKVAVERVVRAMRQGRGAHPARPPVAPAVSSLRFPWWSYPFAAAASVVIAFLVWWGNSERRPDRMDPWETARYVESDEPMSDSDRIARLVYLTMGPIDPPDEFATLVDPSDFAVLAPLAGPYQGVEASPGETEPPASDRNEDDLFL